VGILDIAIRLIFWGIFFAFAWIPGIMIGVLFETTLGHWAYWPGFIIGAAAFLIYIADQLNNSAPKESRGPSPFVVARRVRIAKRYLSSKKSTC
jgi:hypothetical protein